MTIRIGVAKEAAKREKESVAKAKAEAAEKKKQEADAKKAAAAEAKQKKEVCCTACQHVAGHPAYTIL